MKCRSSHATLAVVSAAAIGGCFVSLRATAQVPGSGYQLLWADEFNGSALDRVKWNPAYPWGRVHNYPAYIDDANITVGGGTLNLQAKRQSEGGQPFTSGAVNSNGLFNFHTGYIEASMQLPNWLGAWPAFWSLQDGWPPELDVMEARFRSSYNAANNSYDGYGDMYSYIGTYHWGSGNSPPSAGTGFVYPGGDLTAAFHTYGTLWASDHVTFYFDGRSMGSVYSSSADIAQMQNMYLLLNLGVGGWPGDPPSWADLSTPFKIDWVRVWQQPGAVNLSSTWTRSGNGNQNWDDPTAWSATAPGLGSQTAVFGNLGGSTTDVRLDWNHNKTLGTLMVKSSVNYTIGWPDDSLLMAADSGRAYIIGDASGGNGLFTVGSRVELWNNTSIQNKGLTRPITFNGDIIGNGELSAEYGAIVLNGVGSWLGDTVVTNNASLTFNNLVKGTTNLFVKQGSATISGSGSVTTSEWTSIGQTAGDVGTLNVQGGAFTVNSDLNVGDVSSRGTMNISGTARVAATSLYVGKFGNASGTVIQSGGTVTNVGAGNDWRIGGGNSSADSAAVGVYNLQGGTLTTSTNLQVGAYGRGTLKQTGGTANVSGYLSVGRFAGGNGTYDLSTGNGVLTASAKQYLMIGEQGTGSMLVGGSSVVNANTLSMGHNGGSGSVTQVGGTVNAPGGVALGLLTAGGSGVYNLNGGTLNTTGVSRGLGSGSLFFNGGTLRAAGDNTAFIQGLTTVAIQNGGAIIDTNAHAVTIAQAVVAGGTGGLTKIGDGVLTLTATNSYTGPTTVTGGTLSVNGTTGPGQTSVGIAATLQGTGWVNGPLIADGQVAPGNSPGTLHTHDAELSGSSTLTIEISSATSSDLLDVNGALTLDPGSTLSVQLLNGYTPSVGSQFDLLNWQSLGGTFTNVQLPPLPENLHWDTHSLYSTGVVAVATPEPAGAVLFASFVGILSAARPRKGLRQRAS